MSILELFVLALGLSMDAFAASVCKGLSVERLRPRHALLCGAWFGGFQCLMPLLGWLLGRRFEGMIVSVDHWIAFALLAVIGISMIQGAFSPEEEHSADFAPRPMLMLAVATSVDALAVGVTFAFLSVRILPAAVLIGATTLALSALGVALGHRVGRRFRQGAQLAGGLVLILLGLKILLEHLGLIAF